MPVRAIAVLVGRVVVLVSAVGCLALSAAVVDLHERAEGPLLEEVRSVDEQQEVEQRVLEQRVALRLLGLLVLIVVVVVVEIVATRHPHSDQSLSEQRLPEIVRPSSGCHPGKKQVLVMGVQMAEDPAWCRSLSVLRKCVLEVVR